MDVNSAVKNLLDSFRWSYSKKDCPEMYQYKIEKLKDVIDKIHMFEDLAEEEEIPNNMILYLLDYIANNEVVESFINECIAPFVQNTTIGSDVTDEFYRSIEIYNRQISHVDDQHMVVILTPIYTASSLIQNAYLFVNDLVMYKKELGDYTTEELGTYDIYRYLIKLILNPLKEWILYHLDEQEDVPVLIVSSLGTLTADFMINNAEEFLSKIQENIKAQLDHMDLDELIEQEDEDNGLN